MRFLLIASLSALMILSVTGCVAPSVSGMPGDRDIELCLDQTAVHVAELDSERPDCDIAGVELIFPDGMTMKAPSLGSTKVVSTSAHPGDSWFALNIGARGLAVGANEDGEVTWYGSEEAISAYTKVFGDSW